MKPTSPIPQHYRKDPLEDITCIFQWQWCCHKDPVLGLILRRANDHNWWLQKKIVKNGMNVWCPDWTTDGHKFTLPYTDLILWVVIIWWGRFLVGAGMCVDYFTWKSLGHRRPIMTWLFAWRHENPDWVRPKNGLVWCPCGMGCHVPILQTAEGNTVNHPWNSCKRVIKLVSIWSLLQTHDLYVSHVFALRFQNVSPQEIL